MNVVCPYCHMNRKHTPEPWRIPEGDYRSGIIVGKYLTDVAVCLGMQQDENRDRIVACVNACVGSTDEELKQVADAGGFALLIARWHLEASAHADNADTFADEIEKLEKQRDGLLAALTEIANWVDKYTSAGHPVSTIARQAIAKADEA